VGVTNTRAGVDTAYTSTTDGRLMAVNSDGSKVGIGLIPNSATGEFGFFGLDSSDNLIFKIVNGVYYVYDIANDKNIMQFGKLPDNTYGFAVAKQGKNVSEIF